MHGSSIFFWAGSGTDLECGLDDVWLGVCRTVITPPAACERNPRGDGRLSWQIQWVVMDAGVDAATDAGTADACPALRRRFVTGVGSRSK